MPYLLRIMQVTRIHPGRQHVRIHYIAEWARMRNMRPRDLVDSIGVDKSTVSRWFDGALPKPDHLIALADAFHTDVPSLFRHPDEDWIAHLLRDRTPEERVRIQKLIELTFPSNSGTDG